MNAYNWIDYLILLIFGLSALSGFSRGLIREVMNLATWVVAIIIASTFCDQLAAFFTNIPEVQKLIGSASSSVGVDAAQPASYMALIISFVILFSITMIIGSMIGSFITYAFETTGLGIGNRALGALFGFGKGIIVAIVMIFLIQLTPFVSESSWTSSELVRVLQPEVQWLSNFAAPGMSAIRGRIGNAFDSVNTGVSNLVNGAGANGGNH